MMFTAVTDDGVSLGSERGSELMMDGADPSCPLCNIAYVEGADLCLLPCLHVFHKHCINKWCNRHIVCPLCKRHLEAPEPLHTLTATGGSTHGHGHSGGGPPAGVARSEPGGHHHHHHQQHHHHGARGAADTRGTWRQMLGTAAPGPLSGHGSERGLGGTRSEDGRWNDRVLNAAQQQMDGGRQNRVTSFSSETRRANSARGRAGERGPAGRGAGPPQSSSAGASALRGPQRAQSVSGSVGGRQHRIQRKRSSSFNTGSERIRGSGRVAHGTAPHRGGGGGGSFRGPESNSPRSRSDLGVGSKDADRLRVNSDAMLSRHASRRNNGAGGTKVLTKPMFGEDGAGAWAASAGGKGKGKGKGKTKRAAGEGRGKASGSSQQGGGGRGPAVITVRKAPGRSRSRTSASASVGGTPGGGSVGDFARSGGESEPDFGGERVFTTNSSRHNHYDDDLSPDEVTTKALTYGPRKPHVSRENSASKETSGGHRRQWSTGSTSADEVGSGKKSRRRSSAGSKGGSGNHMLIAGAAATAEAVSKLLGRPSEERSANSVSSSRGGVGGARVSAGAEHSEASSGGESGSDGRAEGSADRRSRRGSARLSSGGSSRRGSQLQLQHRTTPPKTGPVTKGTPAPPMAAARVATWNSSSSAPAPVFDASLPNSMSDAEHQQQHHQLQRAYAEPDGSGRGRGGGPPEVVVGASLADATSSSPIETPVKGRGWGFRIPTSAGSAEFFGLGGGGGSHGSGNGSSNGLGNGLGLAGNSSASAEAADGEHSDTGGFTAGPTLTSKVFSRSSGPSRRGGGGGGAGAVSGVRLFGSGATASTSSRTGPAAAAPAGARGGNHSAFALDSENSPPGGRIDLTASSSELIQTYEKSRSSSDEKGAHSDDWASRAPVTSDGKKRNTKTFTRRRSSGGGGNANMRELAATESELDDDQIDRPKLTYKRRNSRHGHSRSTSRTPSEGEAMARSAMYGSGAEGGLDLSGGHGHHPNGDDWADEEPFHRPKLSYGGGLRSSSRRSATASESGRRSST
ncbi:unnamed protein product [Laminaria digitata]